MQGGQGMQRQRSRFPKYRENTQAQTTPFGGGAAPFGQSAEPGNEPGGANGQYGRFGQTPGQEPSSGFRSQVDSMKRGFTNRMAGTPAGQITKAATDRYGSQGRMDRGVNQMQNQMQNRMREEGQANGMGQMQRQAPQMDAPMSQPPQSDDDAMRQSSAQVDPFAGSAAPLSQPAPQTMQGPTYQQAPPPQPAQAQAQAPQAPQSFASPFGNMRFGQPQAMADGDVVTEPTLAMLGEDGPEAVVPMGGNPDATITPGMMQPRDTFDTGPSSLGKPLHSLPPTSGPMGPQRKFPRYGV
jgi:hypothetical protein